MDAVKLTFPLDEFAFVIILGKSNAKSCSYFISFDLPLLILNFLPLPFWIVVVVDLQLIWPLLICDSSSEHAINKSREYGDLFLSCGCFQGAPSSLLHCTDLEKPELAGDTINALCTALSSSFLNSALRLSTWVNALPLAGHHHVLPLVVDPSPGWLSPWELHVDFLTSAFYLKDSSFPSVILSSRSHRANQLSLRYTVPGLSSSNSPLLSIFFGVVSSQCFCLCCFLSPASTDSPHPVLLLQGNQFIDYHVLSVVSSSVSFCDLVVAAVIGGVPRATKKC
ncbi:hypothetical protein NC652_041448 [Populus alba x Populus x berolinensis]|nr:hypothetical protein NC652_041448 [Populus alba x Populus x berolinensis]